MYHKEGVEPVVVSPFDYLPIWDEEERKKILSKREKENVTRQSAEDMKSMLMSFAKVHNERIARRSKPPIKK